MVAETRLCVGSNRALLASSRYWIAASRRRLNPWFALTSGSKSEVLGRHSGPSCKRRASSRWIGHRREPGRASALLRGVEGRGRTACRREISACGPIPTTDRFLGPGRASALRPCWRRSTSGATAREVLVVL